MAAVGGVAQQFVASGGNTSNWQHAVAGAYAALVPLAKGALSKDQPSVPSMSDNAARLGQALDAATLTYATKKTDDTITNLHGQASSISVPLTGPTAEEYIKGTVAPMLGQMAAKGNGLAPQ